MYYYVRSYLATYIANWDTQPRVDANIINYLQHYVLNITSGVVNYTPLVHGLADYHQTSLQADNRCLAAVD